MGIRSLVSVVDDDESVRESLPDLLKELGYAVRAFASAEEFLASDCIDQTQCLILDISMPGMSGPDLQQELTRRHREIPIVFITAHGDKAVRPHCANWALSTASSSRSARPPCSPPCRPHLTRIEQSPRTCDNIAHQESFLPMCFALPVLNHQNFKVSSIFTIMNASRRG